MQTYFFFQEKEKEAIRLFYEWIHSNETHHLCLLDQITDIFQD